jgi:hypothetical protein
LTNLQGWKIIHIITSAIIMSPYNSQALELYNNIRALIDIDQLDGAIQLLHQFPENQRHEPLYILSSAEVVITTNQPEAILKLYTYLEKVGTDSFKIEDNEAFLYWPINLLSSLLIVEERFDEARKLLDSIVPLTKKFINHVLSSLAIIYNFNHNKIVTNELHKDELDTSFDYDFSAWTVTPDVMSLLYEKIVNSESTSNICEFGSGISTTYIATVIQKTGRGHLYSFEHDYDFYLQTIFELQAHRLSDFVTLVHTPLSPCIVDEVQYSWYDVDCFTQLPQIDVFLVDGPPGHIQKLSRLPAINIISKYSNPSTTIIVDDSYRDDEQEMIKIWQTKLPYLQLIPKQLSKSFTVLEMRAI